MDELSSLNWVAERVLITEGALSQFRKMLEQGEGDAAKTFLVAMLNDRILTGYSPHRIPRIEAAEYYNILGLLADSFPPEVRSV